VWNLSNVRIAVVGIGLRYPDADSPAQLWENVLAGRRAFRRLPDERMNHADYYSPDPAAPDRFYSRTAAVLRDFEFDRVRYKVAGGTFRATDLTHWLALDTAAAALADAGLPDGAGLPKKTTGVVIGNSLTGEFSRANIMRLRWPYVRRTVAAALGAKGWDDDETAAFLRDLETQYKAPFPAIDEDSLAGGLANTIAGRLCNYFDLAGGGYTVDGACSSSLLAVATAAKALADREIDAALAGGVDLSIDPFEVIGFAKTGALATGEMRVYDKGSNGFWPGEGCGVLVLTREEDAIAQGLRVYATITGYGISSDGKGGITRPEAAGHRLAVSRAYDKAGYGVEEVSYFEGHGTGTALGDATEIEALSSARRAADPTAPPAALSTLKGNIGHTKAAAGVAGLIKATLAVHHQVIPPATGHFDPHPLLTAADATMYVPTQPQLWPADRAVRAGVSAMGFGGINTHIAVEAAAGTTRRETLDDYTRQLTAGRQDAELLLFDGGDLAELRGRVAQVAEFAGKLAYAELADLAALLVGRLDDGPARAAVVASNPQDAATKLNRLVSLLADGAGSVFADGIFAGRHTSVPRIAFLFPGQGSGRGAVGAIRRRYAAAEEAFQLAGLPVGGDQVATEVAQPRIVTGSLAALRVLRDFGIDADTAVGHSLGELTALHWGGALSESSVLDLAAVRGRVMADASQGGGGMASLTATPADAMRLAAGEDVVVAGYNGPQQTVLSGPAEALDRVCERARADGLTAVRIRVSHAFHSPLVEPAAVAMTGRLTEFDFAPLERPVVSTVTAAVLDPDTDLRTLLRDQVLCPVRFAEAAADAAAGADLVVEVGPGRVLSGLMEQIAPDTRTLPTDTDSGSLTPLLRVVGAAFALGAPVRTETLVAGRLIRPLPADGSMTFLASPCETAPAIDAELATQSPAETATGTGTVEHTEDISTFELLRRLAAERVELPLDTVHADTHPLDDLHLSSITVGQIVNEVTRELGRPALTAAPNFATVSLGELAEMIDELASTALDTDERPGEVPGVAAWVRAFAVDHVERPVPASVVDSEPGGWRVYAPDGHPLAEPLRAALADVGDGVLLCLPQDGEDHVPLMLAAAKAAADAPRFVVVHHRLGAAGLARTFYLETPTVPTTVVNILPTEAAVARVVAEVRANRGFAEVTYDGDTRTVPVLRAVTPVGDAKPLTQADVLLVTGGGKGITAECALAMAKDSGARLALIGRADPAGDDELAANLARMDAAGIDVRYERADVTSAEQVRTAVEKVTVELGPVTAVLHGAGRNEPNALANLTVAEFERTLAPKITGLRNVLAAVDPDQIKLLVTFGSIIGRAGLRGEAHYSTANDWMTELTCEFQRRHPNARALALEWSVWSGAGMGERLGVVEALVRDGITPISVENGISLLRQVLADPSAGPVLVVSGRAAGLPTLPLERRELPLLRFIDRVKAYYPGIELVTEADLAAGSDPYLADHLLDGDLLFPAVLGMEAMTQVASVVSGSTRPPLLENVEFLRPVVVRPDDSTTIRIAALLVEPGVVDVVIRSSETSFGADHFRARLRTPQPETSGGDGVLTYPIVPVDPVTELYGGVLFQGRRFQKLLAYRLVRARRAVAELGTRSPGQWFATFLPQQRLLADPGTRDAAMHAIQCCVPDATLLPQGIEKLYLASTTDSDYVVMDARERSQDGDSYVYDVDITTPEGELVEKWEGLMLRAVRKRGGAGPWVPALIGSYVERSLERVLGGDRAVVVEPGQGQNRRALTKIALSRALGRDVEVHYRPDGRPEVDGTTVSSSHGAGLTFAVAGSGVLACDVETVIARDSWPDLLGADQLAVRDLLASTEDEHVAATRVWSALECVRKAAGTTQALALDHVDTEGWVVLSTGDARIATWVTTINGQPDPVVFAVLAGVGRKA
jgi:enediyne polyketide synthase